jgi:hypothetical protein
VGEEKPSGHRDVHDVNNTYCWSQPGQSGTEPDGTAFTVFLKTLNDQAFAGTGVSRPSVSCRAFCLMMTWNYLVETSPGTNSWTWLWRPAARDFGAGGG